MKHLQYAFLIVTLLSTTQLTAQERTVIHDQCSDQTFAYNTMTVEKSDHAIFFSLGGATVFVEKQNDWDGYGTSTFSIPRDYCRFSEDQLLMSCSVSALRVERNSGISHTTTKILDVKNLLLKIRYVESVDAYDTGFELNTAYQIDDAEVVNRVVFKGDRHQGCDK